MKKTILLLVIVSSLYACSNNPVDSPGGGGQNNSETLLIDRTGITDSTTDGYLLISSQPLNFPYSSMRVSFSIKGDSQNNQSIVALQKRNEMPFILSANFPSLNSSYATFDTTFSLSAFSDTTHIKLFTNSTIYWLAIRDLKIYGK